MEVTADVLIILVSDAFGCAEVDASGNWSKEVPFEHNGPGYSTGYGVFSDDGNTLVFASDRQDNSFGGFDLFIQGVFLYQTLTMKF